MQTRTIAGIFVVIAALCAVPIHSARAETKGAPKDLGKDPSQGTNPPPAGPVPGTQESLTPGKTTAPAQLKSPSVGKPSMSPRVEENLRNQSQKGIKELPGRKPISPDPGNGPSRITFPPLTGTATLPEQSVTPGQSTAPTQLKSPFVDTPVMSPRMEKDPRDPSLKEIKQLPGGKPIPVGPSIRSFLSINNDCVPPDPNRPILSYRVSASTGGAGIQRVKINALHGVGDRIRVIHDRSAPPGNPWPEVSENGIRDPDPAADVYAYVLVVQDSEGRSISRRLSFRYPMPLRFEFLSRNAVWDPRTSEMAARARLENAGNVRWEYTDAGGTHRNTGARLSRTDGDPNSYNVSWGPYSIGTNRSQAFTITVDPISRSCSEMPIARTITWVSPFGTGVRPSGSAGGGSSGCDDPRVGTACSVHPPECVGRGADWHVPGKYQCVGGEVRCKAEWGRDYCTVCGPNCGGCPGNSCTASSCAPGSICSVLTASPTCKDLNDDSVARTTGRRVCNHIPDFCWTPDEVGRPEIICLETR